MPGAHAHATATVWLAVTAETMRSDPRSELRMPGREADSTVVRVLSHGLRRGPLRRVRVASSLTVEGADADPAAAQILGEDLADLAVADEADAPSVRVTG